MTPDDAITTRVDVRSYLQEKRKAMLIHQSQIGDGNIFSVLPDDLFAQILGAESLVRVQSTVPASDCEARALFAGLPS